MDILPATLFLVVVVGAVLGATWWWLARPPHLARRVLVTLVSADAYAVRGVLWRVRGRWIVLRDVALVHEDGRVTAMDGEIVIDRRNIAFAQVMADGREQLRAAG